MTSSWYHPANNNNNVEVMLGRRRRWWASINTTLNQCNVFIGCAPMAPLESEMSECDTLMLVSAWFVLRIQ